MFQTRASIAKKLGWKYRHLLDPNWVKEYSSQKAITAPHRKPLIEAIASYRPDSILEIGSGPGANLYLCYIVMPRATLVGIDISRAAIKEGRDWIGHIATFYNFKAEKIPYPSDWFDVVFSDEAIRYVRKLEQALDEMKRIAKKAVILYEWGLLMEAKL